MTDSARRGALLGAARRVVDAACPVLGTTASTELGQGAGHDRAQQAGPQGDPRSQRRVADAQPPARQCVSDTMSETR